MNCEWAEGYLSAYLDDALDPQTRQDVGTHVEQCAACSALLEDYRRLDSALATATRVAPPDELRARIFDSPAFAAILRAQERRNRRPARARIINLASHTPRVRRSGGALRRSALRTGDSAPSVTPIGAASSPPTTTPQSPQRTRRRAPVWAGVLAPVAAVLLLAIGATLLFRQGLLPFQGTSSGHGTSTTIAGYNPTGAPLAAGPRLVFAHDGALWSAPQHGPAADGLPSAGQRLTPSGMQVVGWQAAPASNGAHATLIAYIDGHTGALHIVRSDSQNDQVVGSVTSSANGAFWASAAGHATLAALSWSPDGTHLAYLRVSASGAISLRVVNADGSHDTVVDAGANGQPSAGVWSADGRWLAFTVAGSAGQQVWAYHLGAAAVTLAHQADPFDAQAQVRQMAWLTGATPTLTWATGDAGSLTGVFVATAQGTTGQSTRLTPAPDRFTTADFSPARNAWLIAGPNSLITLTGLASSAPQMTPVATLDAPARLIVWSPTGQSAAIVSGDTLASWSPAAGLAYVTRGVAASPTPVWSADGSRLAYVAGSSVVSAILQQGHVTTLEVLARAPVAYGLRWSPDGRMLGIAIPSGVLLVTAGGSHVVLVDAHAADNGALAWSIAG